MFFCSFLFSMVQDGRMTINGILRKGRNEGAPSLLSQSAAPLFVSLPPPSLHTTPLPTHNLHPHLPERRQGYRWLWCGQQWGGRDTSASPPPSIGMVGRGCNGFIGSGEGPLSCQIPPPPTISYGGERRPSRRCRLACKSCKCSPALPAEWLTPLVVFGFETSRTLPTNV